MTVASTTAARRLNYQLESLWDYDYVPTHHELESLYETAKKNQWNGSSALDWTRPVGKEGPVLNVQLAFGGSPMFNRFLFSDVLIPRLGKLGLIGDRVAPRYREIGLIETP